LPNWGEKGGAFASVVVGVGVGVAVSRIGERLWFGRGGGAAKLWEIGCVVPSGTVFMVWKVWKAVVILLIILVRLDISPWSLVRAAEESVAARS
jgi:hypothetical protein